RTTYKTHNFALKTQFFLFLSVFFSTQIQTPISSLFESLLQPKQTQTKPSFLNMTTCVGIRWPLFEHFGPSLGGFEVWVYMPSSRTTSPENELLGICKF
ncbi:unnamed protein product, partial [Prunus brigantina]